MVRRQDRIHASLPCALVAKGASVNATNNDGATALIAAAANNGYVRRSLRAACQRREETGCARPRAGRTTA